MVWGQESWASSGQQQKKSLHILIIELLFCQFMSPVHWIKSQVCLFKHFVFEWFIEIDPSATLTSMATQILMANYKTQDNSIMALCKNVLPTAIHQCHTDFLMYLLTWLVLLWLLPEMNLAYFCKDLSIIARVEQVIIRIMPRYQVLQMLNKLPT